MDRREWLVGNRPIADDHWLTPAQKTVELNLFADLIPGQYLPRQQELPPWLAAGSGFDNPMTDQRSGANSYVVGSKQIGPAAGVISSSDINDAETAYDRRPKQEAVLAADLFQPLPDRNKNDERRTFLEVRSDGATRKKIDELRGSSFALRSRHNKGGRRIFGEMTKDAIGENQADVSQPDTFASDYRDSASSSSSDEEEIDAELDGVVRGISKAASYKATATTASTTKISATGMKTAHTKSNTMAHGRRRPLRLRPPSRLKPTEKRHRKRVQVEHTATNDNEAFAINRLAAIKLGPGREVMMPKLSLLLAQQSNESKKSPAETSTPSESDHDLVRSADSDRRRAEEARLPALSRDFQNGSGTIGTASESVSSRTVGQMRLYLGDADPAAFLSIPEDVSRISVRIPKPEKLAPSAGVAVGQLRKPTSHARVFKHVDEADLAHAKQTARTTGRVSVTSRPRRIVNGNTVNAYANKLRVLGAAVRDQMHRRPTKGRNLRPHRRERRKADAMTVTAAASQSQSPQVSSQPGADANKQRRILEQLVAASMSDAEQAARHLSSNELDALLAGSSGIAHVPLYVSSSIPMQ